LMLQLLQQPHASVAHSCLLWFLGNAVYAFAAAAAAPLRYCCCCHCGALCSCSCCYFCSCSYAAPDPCGC
jgi:hypothetical protein